MKVTAAVLAGADLPLLTEFHPIPQALAYAEQLPPLSKGEGSGMVFASQKRSVPGAAPHSYPLTERTDHPATLLGFGATLANLKEGFPNGFSPSRLLRMARSVRAVGLRAEDALLKALRAGGYDPWEVLLVDLRSDVISVQAMFRSLCLQACKNDRIIALDCSELRKGDVLFSRQTTTLYAAVVAQDWNLFHTTSTMPKLCCLGFEARAFDPCQIAAAFRFLPNDP